MILLLNKLTLSGAGLEPLKNILRSLGGWPVLEGIAWLDPEFKWYTTNQKTGIYFLANQRANF